jgi:hypothetical protein
LHLLEDVVFWRKKLLGRSQHSPLWTTTTCKSIQFNFCCILSYLLTGKGMGNFAGEELGRDESMKWWWCGDVWWTIIYIERYRDTVQETLRRTRLCSPLPLQLCFAFTLCLERLRE